MAIYDAGKMADAIVKGLVGELPPTVHHKPGTLKVTQKTYLKPSTKQSSHTKSDCQNRLTIQERL